MNGENDFFTDIANNKLPSGGGVFYIRGGYYNIVGPDAADPEPELSRHRRPHRDARSPRSTPPSRGDDDHPSYSDKQLSKR